jgi:hypothetical protein
MKINRSILIKFIYKFFFILKAASDGWIVKHIDKNKYDFYKYILKSNKLYKVQLDISQFLSNYACDLTFLI